MGASRRSLYWASFGAGSRASEAVRKGVGGMYLVVQSGFWYASGRSDEPSSCLVAEASGQRSQATACLFCVSWLINPSFAQTAAFPGKLPNPPSATFMRVARVGAARAHNHSTPAAPPPANSTGESPLTSPLLSSPAVYQNPDAGVAHPADVGLARNWPWGSP